MVLHRAFRARHPKHKMQHLTSTGSRGDACAIHISHQAALSDSRRRRGSSQTIIIIAITITIITILDIVIIIISIIINIIITKLSSSSDNAVLSGSRRRRGSAGCSGASAASLPAQVLFALVKRNIHEIQTHCLACQLKSYYYHHCHYYHSCYMIKPAKSEQQGGRMTCTALVLARSLSEIRQRRPLHGLDTP